MATTNTELVNRRGLKVEGIASYPHLDTAVAFNSATNRSEPVNGANAAAASYSVDLYLTKDKATAVGKRIKEIFDEDQTVKESKGGKLVDAALAGKEFSIVNRPLVKNTGESEYFPADKYPAVLKLKLRFQTASGELNKIKIDTGIHDVADINGGDQIAVTFSLGKGYTGATGNTNGYPTYISKVELIEPGVVEIEGAAKTEEL